MALLHEKYNSLRRAAELAVRNSNDFAPLVDRILTDVIFQSIRKYQQKVGVGLQDSVADLLIAFKQKILGIIFDAANCWKIPTIDPILFPKNCRFCYMKGETTILVIEQDPQVRSLLFDKGITRETYFSTSEQERFSLALPYVIFILLFQQKCFTNLYCAWRSAPLTNLSDRLCRPLLPNIHSNLSVCMGGDFSNEGGAVCEQVENVLNHFWSSQFNNDLSDLWWQKHTFDSKLAPLTLWEEYTRLDPLFVLNVAFPWSQKTLKQMLTIQDIEEMPDDTKLRHSLSESVDSCASELFQKVSHYLKKTKFEKFYPKDIVELVDKVVREAIKNTTDLTFCLDHEIRKLTIETSIKPLEYKKAGPFWRDYL